MKTALTPFRGFVDLQGEMACRPEDVFGAPLRRSERGAAPPVRWAPAADVLVEDGNPVVRAGLPGISPEDVDVSLENVVLTISGEREEDGEGYHVRELRYGSFERGMRPPGGGDVEKVHARFRDGVLEATVEGAAAVEEPGHIEIGGTGS